MGAWDDDDWTGTPPEGRVTRDRARPEHWRQAFPAKTVFLGILGALMVVVALLALL